jgi:ferritin-like protein
MLSKKNIDKINNLVSKKKFKYTGELISGTEIKSDIDYTFKITGYKKMMSVGEYYDYTLINVTIIGVNDHLSKLIFSPDQTEQGEMMAKSFESRLYKFYSDLNLEIREFLSIFDSSIRTTINEFNIDLKESITESNMSRMSRIAVRTTVKDILNIIKDKKEGNYYLPSDDGEEYSFTNLPFSYSVELTIKIDENIDGYKLGGDYSSEDDVIEIIILFNPKTLRNHIYNIIGELNDIVAHELEHGFQYVTEGKIYKDPPTGSFDYYTQIDEVKSQRVGFRRLAKLTKSPYTHVIKEWFDTHRDVHGLTLNEEKKVINIILDNK